jgi:AcrR family transcriptional regulator
VEEHRAPVRAVTNKMRRFVHDQRQRNATPVPKRVDRRIRKTQDLLRSALRSLIGEKDYDAITVQEILDRANVGRSTFYMHFRDKDELLTSGIHDILSSTHAGASPAAATSRDPFTWFSLPILENIDRHRHHEPTREDRMGTRGRAIVHEHLRTVLAALIAEEVTRDHQGRRRSLRPIPPDLLVQHVASTFILVLNWWVETRSSLAPKDVHELFRSLILQGTRAE